jgi:hypothetical protein
LLRFHLSFCSVLSFASVFIFRLFVQLFRSLYCLFIYINVCVFLPWFICLSVRSILDLVVVVVQWKCKKEVRSSIRHLIDDLEDTARKMLDHFK